MSPRKRQLPADALVASGYPDELEVEHVGLGYVGTLMPAGVVFSVDRIVHQRGDLMAELTVERAPEGHVFVGRFNLSDVGERRRTAAYLGERTNNVDWTGALEELCLAVLHGERAGKPFEMLGEHDVAEAEVTYLMAPLLVEGRPNVIYGEGGAGKSTVAAAAALAIASGVAVVPGWVPVDKAGVLIVDWEADLPEWDALISTLAKGRGIRRAEYAKRLHYRAGAGPITDSLDEIAQHIAQHDVRLLIIDSVGLAMPSRSEGADANEGALKLFSALRILGITTLLIDHVAGVDMGKEGAVPKPYGSVYKYNLGRNLFELRAVPPAPDNVQRVALYHRKANRGPKRDPLGLAMHRGPGELTFQVEEVDGFEANVPIPVHARIERYLGDVGRATVSDIADAAGVTREAARATLSRMARLGRVTRLPGGGRNPSWGLVSNRARLEAQHEAQHVALPPEEVDPWG